MQHLLKQPFVLATGAAAFIHSTWALGVLFGGMPPDMALTLEFVYWLTPAALIAFALDVGQISTSARIRSSENNFSLYATFAVFACATYFLQWLYIAHHMPALELSSGVREQWQPLVSLIRDFSLWLIPAFLPLSTLLYTLSSDNHDNKPQRQAQAQAQAVQAPAIVVSAMADETPSQTQETQENAQAMADTFNTFSVTCDCGWQAVKASNRSAQQALRAHKMHCQQVPMAIEPNGKGKH